MNKFSETADIETASDDYAIRFSGGAGRWMLAEQLRCFWRVAKACGVTERAKILDVGGGHGQISNPLAELGYDVTATGSADVCAAKLAPQVKFTVADNLNLPFSDGAFDLVTCFRLVPHCQNWQQLISELCRVSRRGVIVDYPTTQSINFVADKFFGAKKGIEKNTRPFTLFSHAEIANAFLVSDFEVQSKEPQFVAPMVLHRMLKSPAVSQGIELLLSPLAKYFGSPVILGAVRVSLRR
jgi:2-polyprenyl-3-methyl-5-hydroxy-6-metoxy-1,4-benzoquinol methylase